MVNRRVWLVIPITWSLFSARSRSALKALLNPS
uniref:Uncharacterized protein n=1 Tax=Arundo donax TaxID=35708 RepID=A0A0A8YNJ4_ARUDO